MAVCTTTFMLLVDITIVNVARRIAHAGKVAFVSGFRLILLIACATVFVGAPASVAFIRRGVAEAPAPVPSAPS